MPVTRNKALEDYRGSTLHTHRGYGWIDPPAKRKEVTSRDKTREIKKEMRQEMLDQASQDAAAQV